MINWKELKSINQIDEIKTASWQGPILIFKHSTTCSISATALHRLERRWNQANIGELETYLLDLHSYRAVSNEVAATFGVEHESPQVLLIENGECTYHESHWGINFDDIVEAVEIVGK